ncbi:MULTISPECIES: IscS subfamily cysteine desulfurase [Bacillaceae]|uniref:IscS subfamily cysteine desulfurase n=1 Tax=Bacillaceae TaxID=186817 RepID=UPI001E5C0BB8|nr:IscS subfamily cysteine desulfurase [Bacillus sp. Au-Bac7]MCE4048064.1 IscS subfamily cysteine desulfurase [Bacillus sp. Au-Bac7]
MIYLDYAATCPLDADAGKTYIEAASDYFGNSSSLHSIGGKATDLLESCREEMARLLSVERVGIYFTSGGTESNFLAIHALLSVKKKAGNHIITTESEHSSIHGTMKWLEKQGYEITYLPLSPQGMVDADLLQAAIKPETVLVSIQHVNAEIGAIQPIAAIGKILKEKDIYFHSDMVQSFGKIDISSISNTVDALSISSHKFYGPKGIGLAYVSPLIPWTGFLPGSTHEKGFRAGTVNIAGIAAMTTAAQKSVRTLAAERAHYQGLREMVQKRAKHNISLTVFQCEHQLPSIIGMRIHGLEGQWTMLECNRRGFAISTGSACQTGQQAPSKTMKAMGLCDGSAKEFIRISFGRQTKPAHVEAFMETVEALAVK